MHEKIHVTQKAKNLLTSFEEMTQIANNKNNAL